MPARSSRFPWRRALTGGVAALALTTLAACGGGDSHSASDGESGSGGSWANTDSSGSASPGSSGSASTSPDSSGEDSSTGDLQAGDDVSPDDMAAIFKKAMTGVKTAHMSMSGKVSAQGQSLTMDGEGDVSMQPLAEDMTMSMMGQKMHVILVNGIEYMQMSSGGKWLKMDLKKVAKQSGMGDLSNAMTNPLSMIDSMSDAISKATYEGSDSNGDHYEVTVDTAKAMAKMGGGKTVPPGMPSQMTEDLWFDDDGHMYKMSMDMGSTGSVDAEMTDYGKAVHIKAPPASQVTEMPSGG